MVRNISASPEEEGSLATCRKEDFPAEMQCWIWMCWFARELVIETDTEPPTGLSWRRFKECYKENECVCFPCSPGMCMLLMAEFVSYLLEEERWHCCVGTAVWIFSSSLNFAWFSPYPPTNCFVFRTSSVTFHVVILSPFFLAI